VDKCQFPNGLVIKPDGITELDPCVYDLMEEHRNVTVKVYRCSICGSVDISWEAQEDTESTIFKELDKEN
jgi:flavodoxin